MKSIGSSESKKADKKEVETPASAPAVEVKEVIDFSKVEIEPLFKDDVDFETFSKSDFRAVKVKECVAVPKSKKLLQFTLDDGTGEDRTILSGIHAYYEPEELIGKTLIAITNLPPRKMMGIDSCGMIISAVHSEEGEERLHVLMVDDHIPAGAPRDYAKRNTHRLTRSVVTGYIFRNRKNIFLFLLRYSNPVIMALKKFCGYKSQKILFFEEITIYYIVWMWSHTLSWL